MYTRYLVTKEQEPTPKPLTITLPDWVLPLLVGTFILGAFVWTPVGRSLAVSPIAKGANVSKRKVES